MLVAIVVLSDEQGVCEWGTYYSLTTASLVVSSVNHYEINGCNKI